MNVEVIVPFLGGCEHRERAWSWVRARYESKHPDWDLVEATGGAPWCKAAAALPALEAAKAEIIILADADVWTDGLREAVGAVELGVPWAIPHDQVRRLSERGTAALLSSEAELGSKPLDRPLYRGIPGGGVVVGSREALFSIPMDRRFTGWGQEDESWAIALGCMLGPPWRGKSELLHLFHPPQPRLTRRRGSNASWRLRCRYFAARNDPSVMRALLEESRAIDLIAH